MGGYDQVRKPGCKLNGGYLTVMILFVELNKSLLKEKIERMILI